MLGKRIFDIFFSFFGILFLLPFYLLIALFISVDSRGGVFYKQIRVGKNNCDFKLFKFRTMRTGSDKKGLLTVGGRDPRITSVGYFLRKYKLDELPQLLNVLAGDMSFVGPRPEVRKYVDLYSKEQKEILKVRPGITDYASIEYFQENELLAKAEDPEKEYIEVILPHKITLNKKYIKKAGVWTDIQIIARTFGKIFTS